MPGRSCAGTPARSTAPCGDQAAAPPGVSTSTADPGRPSQASLALLLPAARASAPLPGRSAGSTRVRGGIIRGTGLRNPFPDAADEVQQETSAAFQAVGPGQRPRYGTCGGNADADSQAPAGAWRFERVLRGDRWTHFPSPCPQQVSERPTVLREYGVDKLLLLDLAASVFE